MLKLESKEAVEYVLEEYPKLNKSRLAKMLGVSPQAINNYITYNYLSFLPILIRALRG